jgi:N-acetylglucosaminyl-diphospho-decaprenol L-rhamnosyltransferase
MVGMIDVSIIIVNYRTRGLVKQCLKSIRRVGLAPTYEIFVVDNDGAETMRTMLREEFPEVKGIIMKKNVGFAAANNAAMREAKGRYIFILNPDTELLPGAIEKMLLAMEQNPDIGILAPKLVHPDRSPQESVHRFPSPMVPIFRRTPLGRLAKAKAELDRYFLRDAKKDQPMEVDWAVGAALFVRRSAIEKVGMFDERYFLYFEDTDWARRFWEQGWKVVYWPLAEVLHYHRRESADGAWFTGLLNRVTRYHIASAVKYFLKWKGQAPPSRKG